MEKFGGWQNCHTAQNDKEEENTAFHSFCIHKIISHERYYIKAKDRARSKEMREGEEGGKEGGDEKMKEWEAGDGGRI